MRLRLAAAVLLALALPAQAQVYKWVDAQGRVNYGNAPPPSAAGSAQTVEEKLSVMGIDPAVRAYAERHFAARAAADERDWQLRQQAMSLQYASAPAYDSSYYPDYYGPGYYYGGAYYPRPGRPIARAVFRNYYANSPRPTPHMRVSSASRSLSRR